MEFQIVDYNEFIKNKDYYYEQIPKAQNAKEKYKQYIFNYYNDVLKNKKAFSSICKIDNEIVGIATVIYYKEENKYFLINVNTRKDCQNKKIGTNVVKNGIKHFFDNNIENELYLWVNKDNNIAKKLYNNIGFKQTSYFPEKLEFAKNIKNDDIFCITKKDFIKKYSIQKKEFI